MADVHSWLAAIADSSFINLITALGGVGGVVLTYVEFQRRRDKQTAIREAFEGVIADLASEQEPRRLAASILLRRFFDEKSELGMRSVMRRARTAPYAQEAVSVMAAVLRGLKTGNVQKLLADGLAYAPDLRGADLQRANLQNAYLRPHRKTATLEGADFYRADLSGASLKNAIALRAVFYQARLNGTVFTGADLRGANFYQADLSASQFSDALLLGATFEAAVHIPQEVGEHLDAQGVYTLDIPVSRPQASARTTEKPRRVFFSTPSRRSERDQALVDRLTALLRDQGLAVETLRREDYPSSGQLSEVRRKMAGCCGAVILGFSQPETLVPTGMTDGSVDVLLPTPWNHLEAGMAFAYDIPLLIVVSEDDRRGIFDEQLAERSVHRLGLDSPLDLDPARTGPMKEWLALVLDHELPAV